MHPVLQSTVSLSHTVLSTPMINYTEINPDIKRTDELTRNIQTIFNSEKEKPKAFSATSINSFIKCSLQFYFKYIAQIAEPKETDEEIDAARFGEIFHLVMHTLYEPYKGKVLDKTTFDEIKLKINDTVIAAIRKLYDEQYNKKGQAYLIEKIITRYAENVIETDKASAGFVPAFFEETYFGKLTLENNFSVAVKGTLDRIDILNGATRIVDYKTGNDKVESPKEFQLIFEDTKFKINLQLLMYAWLAKQNSFLQPINAGIYPLRRISSGIEMISDKINIDDEILNKFENNLNELIQKIIFTTDFVQTDDLKNCVYCPYKTICNR
jgi:CRISPR/Cas system-associated exonuclease Cas4 (RecB family)